MRILIVNDDSIASTMSTFRTQSKGCVSLGRVAPTTPMIFHFAQLSQSNP